jgi:hypothetical protein
MGTGLTLLTLATTWVGANVLLAAVLILQPLARR